MPLTSGDRLGAYEIVSTLGAGGMGEVYAAHDTRLNRRVAIKILPDAYASDPDRIARFHREAQAAATLNHPNIAAIYDLAEAPSPAAGQTDVVRYLILELIEGDTLADRLRQGPLPAEDLFRDLERFFVAPQLLPGGQAVLYSIKKTAEVWDRGQIVVQALDGGARKTLVDGGTNGRYVPTGHLVYALSGTLLAVRFDLGSLAVSGGPVPVVEGVRRAGMASGASNTVADFSFSSSGTLTYVPGPATASDTGTDLALFNRNRDVQLLKLPPGQYSSPRVSHDGKFFAFERADERQSIWVYEFGGGRAAQQLTFGGNNRAPVWSGDGQWIAFQSDREGDLAMWRQRADGTGAAERLSKPEANAAHTPQSWTPDGAHLLFSVEKSNQSTLWTMTVKDRRIVAFGDVPAREAVFSPDGRWVAYQVPEAASAVYAANAVYLEPFPRTGAKYLVPQGGGHPFWSPKGDEIIMNAGPSRSRVIAVTTTPRVSFGRPADFPRLGRTEGNPLTVRRNLDMMPDGQHVLGVTSPVTLGSGEQAAQITVVLNWFDELRQRVPVR